MFLKMHGDFLDVGERLGDVGREIFYKEEKEMSKLQDFLNKMFNLFPNFSTDWDINELPYVFFGDFVCFIEKNSISINMADVDYIINLFLNSTFQKGDKENIIIVGFLEVLQDDNVLYKKLKNCSTHELKKIFEQYF